MLPFVLLSITGYGPATWTFETAEERDAQLRTGLGDGSIDPSEDILYLDPYDGGGYHAYTPDLEPFEAVLAG